MIIKQNYLFLGVKEVAYTCKKTNEPKVFNRLLVFDAASVDSISLSYDESGQFKNFKFGDNIELELKVIPDGKNFKYFLKEA